MGVGVGGRGGGTTGTDTSMTIDMLPDVSTTVNTNRRPWYAHRMPELAPSAPTTTDGAEQMPSAELCCPPLTDNVLDEEQASVLAVRLKALADPARLRLLSLMANADDGEVCACDLPGLLDRKQPTISHHLKLLTDAGLIVREQRGKWAWFRLASDGLPQVWEALGAVPTSGHTGRR